MLGAVMWSIVIPVKRLSLAKTRLSAALAGSARDDLPPDSPQSTDQPPGVDWLPANGRIALAMASDTVCAALASTNVATVVVVTDDQLAAGTLSALGAMVVPDAPDDGLNAALRYGATAAAVQRPQAGVVALSADLAALRPAELSEALDLAAGYARAFVADVQGTGTTLLSALPGIDLAPRFGTESAQAHRRHGAHPLVGGWPSLRRDLDTPADLAVAARIGLGPATAAQLALLAPELTACAC
ncbi:MAG: 2-phospho-L-lactate guanylyltransferase [Geodermatophilaceae bacterium]|nr:2-phospho-L-lactate guanylyltransferase [Geodermatophilaceae bacterium]